MTPWSSSPRSSEPAPFPGQLKCLALPLVEALGIGPVNISAGDAVEHGDSVTRHPRAVAPSESTIVTRAYDRHVGSSALVSEHVKRVCAIVGLLGWLAESERCLIR